MGYNKVILGDDVLLDLSADTVTPADVRTGVTFHGADGEQYVGEMEIEDLDTELDAQESKLIALLTSLDGKAAGGNTSRLPAGYTEIDSIYFDGEKYINTGFSPNQNTRVVVECIMPVTSGATWLFGARQASLSNSFSFLSVSNVYRADYGAKETSLPSGVSFSDRMTVDFNKNALSVGTYATTLPVQTFQSPVPLVLFGVNTNGTITKTSGVRGYAAKVYDNGSLVRDFVLCKNANGVEGMYDLIGGSFHTIYGEILTGSGIRIYSGTIKPPSGLGVYINIDTGVSVSANDKFIITQDLSSVANEAAVSSSVILAYKDSSENYVAAINGSTLYKYANKITYDSTKVTIDPYIYLNGTSTYKWKLIKE